MYPFHLAVNVRDIAEARKFYGQVLGCAEGRSDNTWVDFDFFGHQLVCHLDSSPNSMGHLNYNPVDGYQVPVPHFGVVVDFDAWAELVGSLSARGIDYVVEPHTRFEGSIGEQATAFFFDPSGNALEFKAFKERDQLFAR